MIIYIVQNEFDATCEIKALNNRPYNKMLCCFETLHFQIGVARTVVSVTTATMVEGVMLKLIIFLPNILFPRV